METPARTDQQLRDGKVPVPDGVPQRRLTCPAVSVLSISRQEQAWHREIAADMDRFQDGSGQRTLRVALRVVDRAARGAVCHQPRQGDLDALHVAASRRLPQRPHPVLERRRVPGAHLRCGSIVTEIYLWH
jgi:hypothetical protein